MGSTHVALAVVIALDTCSLGARVSAQDRRLVIAASVVLDGKGGVRRDTRIVIEGGRIVALDPKPGLSTTICAV